MIALFKKSKLRSALAVILAAVIITTPLGMGRVRAFEAQESIIYQIGVNPETVTATLNENGVLEISGVGEIQNYTKETAPFDHISQSITAVKIGGGISSIGNYLFYNCSRLTGELSLPEKLVKIGDKAFSGDSAELAPKPMYIINPFTSVTVARLKESLPTAAPAGSQTQEVSGLSETLPESENSLSQPDSEASSTASEPEASENVQGEGAPVSSTVSSSQPGSSSETVSSFEDSSSPGPVSEEEQYVVETIDRQELGEEIFYPFGKNESRYFTCSRENTSFREAMINSGYTQADSMIQVALDFGEGSSSTGAAIVKNIPVCGERIIVPNLPGEFAPPDSTGPVSYSFGGWTESQDPAGLVRQPGSEFEAKGREDIYFIAGWNKRVLIDIVSQREGDKLKLSVPEIDGYDILAYCWQECELEKEQAVPENQNNLLWADISGEVESVYVRSLQPGDENRLFRCVLTVSKQQGFLRALFGSSREELALQGVRGGGLSATSEVYTVTCAGGSYVNNGEEVFPTGDAPEPIAVRQGDYAVIPGCTYTPPTISGNTLVFAGWSAQSGGNTVTYDPGDMICPEENLVLTAQWGVANIVYVKSGSLIAAAGNGTLSSPYKSLNNGLKAFSDGNFYTNYVVLLSDLADATLNDAVPSAFPNGVGVTITSTAPGGSAGSYTLTMDSAGIKMGGDIRFENITLSGSDKSIYAQGKTFVMGENAVFDGSAASLYGGYESGSNTGSPRLILQNGFFLTVYGGGYQGTLTGDPKICMSGNAKAGLVFGAGRYIASVVDGNAEVLLSGNSTAAIAVGGGRSSDNGAGLTGRAHVMVGGNATVTDPNQSIMNNSNIKFLSSGFIAGSGADACKASEDGNVRGGTLVEVRENAYIENGVYGGSGDGWSDSSITDANQTSWLGTKGDMKVHITGGTIGGSVYGGGNNRSCLGNSTIQLESGSIAGSVYGGGCNGDVTGNSQVTISGGAIAGGIYGGGDQGEIFGNSLVELAGGTVAGNVFGGSRGVSGSPDIGAVTGNSCVSITGGIIGTYTGSAGDTFDQTTGSVYGGGEYAKVAAAANTGEGGNSSVTIDILSDKGGYPAVGGSAYGGGSRAPVENESSVILKTGRIGGSLYGAGYGAQSSAGSSRVQVVDGTVGANVYGGGAEGTVTSGTVVNVQGGSMLNVFAAGEGNENSGVDRGRVSGSAQVTVSGGSVTGGVYGGGYLGVVGSGSNIDTDSGIADGAVSVTVSGGSVGSVFGGGSGSGGDPSFGTVYGSTQVMITGGAVAGNVHGGGNYAYVTGNTQISINAGEVRGSIFGGGNLNRSPEEGFDNNSFLVLGNSSVELDGSTGLTVMGSVFGSGNLTRVQGTKALRINNYTGSLMSVQRTSKTELINSSLTLSGADDITDDKGTKLFTITKVDDLRLTNSTLRLEGEARELGAVGNYDSAGTVSREEASRSTLEAIPGLLLQIIPSTESGGTGGYGPVSGVMWLEMGGDAAGGRGVRIEADLTGSVGDGATDTGSFIKKNTAANEGLEMISGTVEGSHSFWRLGGSVLERSATLTAPRSQGGGQAVITQTIQLPTASGSTFYKITDMEITGDIQLIKPTEGSDGSYTLPAFESGQNAGNTYGLITKPSDSENRGTWDFPETGDPGWGSYILTQLPTGETAWNSQVQGVWKMGEGYPTTVASGAGSGNNAEFSFSLVYDTSYSLFAGGKVALTFQEYRTGGSMSESDKENTVVVELTLEGEQGGSSQTAFITGGRKFEEFTLPEQVAVTEDGAVTAAFTTVYYPSAAGASNMYLQLSIGEENAAAVFPAGTRIVLADTSLATHRYYFYRALGDTERISLAGFTNMSSTGSATYPGPASISDKITEKLLFAVDFSGVEEAARLAPGNYSLRLLHSAGENLATAAPAAFTISPGQEAALGLVTDDANTTDTGLALKITPQIYEGDTRYADGAEICLSLSDSEGRAKGFPSKTQVKGGAQSVLRNGDGTISFSLPSSGESKVMLDFASVPESMMASGTYEISAQLRPRTGLQVGSNQGAADAAGSPISFTLARTVQPQRGLSVELSSTSKRLIDASEQSGIMEFSLSVKMEEGDTLTAEVLKKTGVTPEPASYTYLSQGDTWWEIGALSGNSANGVLTIPQGTESGTYRILFKVKDSAGVTIAEEPYNFIVK